MMKVIKMYEGNPGNRDAKKTNVIQMQVGDQEEKLDDKDGNTVNKDSRRRPR